MVCCLLTFLLKFSLAHRHLIGVSTNYLWMMEVETKMRMKYSVLAVAVWFWMDFSFFFFFVHHGAQQLINEEIASHIYLNRDGVKIIGSLFFLHLRQRKSRKLFSWRISLHFSCFSSCSGLYDLKYLIYGHVLVSFGWKLRCINSRQLSLQHLGTFCLMT